MSVVIAFALPGSAKAQVPGCQQQHPGLAFIEDRGAEGSALESLAWGASGPMRIHSPTPPATVTVSAADPSRPIAYPFQVPQNESVKYHSIRSGPNDGPIRVTVEWQDSESGQPCRRADEHVIQTGTVRVVGDDHYDLDRDGDGIGCDA